MPLIAQYLAEGENPDAPGNLVFGAPRAVAIHIVYLTGENELRIRHFTSETNDDITNPAGKFNEALEKLVSIFKDDQRNETLGLKKLLEHYQMGTYPGLGTCLLYTSDAADEG